MKHPIRMMIAVPLTALTLSAGGCDTMFLPVGTMGDHSFSERTAGQSRWLHGWESGTLAPLDGRVSGRFELVDWKTPRTAEPEGSIEGRVLRLWLVAGAPGETWGMAAVAVWLPPRSELVPGGVIDIPPEDMRVLACAGFTPGAWEVEEDAAKTGGTVRVDPNDADVLHIDFDSGFSSRGHLGGSASVRVPRNGLTTP